MDGETKSHNLINSNVFSHLEGKAFPSGLLCAALLLPAGGAPATPPSEIARRVERLDPAVRLLVPRIGHGSFRLSSAYSRKTGTGRGIPARPAFSDL